MSRSSDSVHAAITRFRRDIGMVIVLSGVLNTLIVLGAVLVVLR